MKTKHKIAPDPKWSKPEKWVWDQICKGEIADFNDKDKLEKDKFKKTPDPRKKEEWKSSRKISSGFLHEIIHIEEYKNAIHPLGLRIRGAWVVSTSDSDKTLDYGNIEFKKNLWIEQSRIEVDIKLEEAEIEKRLSFYESFLSGLYLVAANIGQCLSLRGVIMSKELEMSNIIVGQHLEMYSSDNVSSTFNEVELIGAQIKGNIDIRNATVKNKLDMNSITIGQHLYMRSEKAGQPSTFNEVELIGAQINGDVDIQGATVNNMLDMAGITVGQHLLMNGIKEGLSSTFEDVDLIGAQIDGRVDMRGVYVKKMLDMDSITIGQYLFMRSITVGQENTKEEGLPSIPCVVNLFGAKIGVSLFLTNAVISKELNMRNIEISKNLYMNCWELTHVDLTSANIKGLLDFGMFKSTIKFKGEKKIILRYVRAEALRFPNWHTDKGNVPDLELDGMRYNRFGGWEPAEEDENWLSKILKRIINYICMRVLNEECYNQHQACLSKGKKDSMNKWSARDFKKFLALDKSYTPQPYHQMAKVLTEIGHKEKASKILFWSKQVERREAWKRGHLLKWFAYVLLENTIGYGYGYKYFRSLKWIFLLTAIGAWQLSGETSFLSVFTEFTEKNIEHFICSFDRLLPVVTLDKAHLEIPLCVTQKYYFYFHSLAGYILAGFIVAGLAGITKK